MSNVATESCEQLKRLFRLGIATFNEGDWAFTTPGGKEYRSHISPDFVAQFDAHQRMLTFTELMNAFQDWYDKNPGFKCIYKSLNAHVDEETGTGVVHYELELSYENMGQEGIGEMRFKRDWRGEWMMYSYFGIRGLPGMGGFV